MKYRLYKKRYFIFTLFGGILLLAIAAFGSRFVQLRSNAAVTASPLIAAYNTQLLTASTGITTTGTLNPTIVSIAEKRKQELLKEMRSNPARFMASILTPAQRAGLPQELYTRGLLEKEVTLSGTLSTVHGDTADGKGVESRRILVTHNGSKPVLYTVHFATSEQNANISKVVSLTGVVLGSELLVSPQQRVTATPGPSPTPPRDETNAWPSTGNVRALVITFRFAEDFNPPQISREAIKQTVFSDTPGSVKTYFKDASRSRLQFTGDVTSIWYPIPQRLPVRDCLSEYPEWLNEAYKHADIDYDMSQYQVFIFFNPTVSGCSPLGASSPLGSNFVWVNGYNDTSGYVHELGHALSFQHAGSAECGDKIIDKLTNCRFSERSDPFDPMGFGHTEEFSSAYKKVLGWVNPNEITSVSASGVYSLLPLGSPATGLKGISLKGPADPSDTRIKQDYYIEYRKKVGLDSNISEEGVQARLFAYLPDTLQFHSTSLLDGSPSDRNISTAAIPQSNALVDFDNKVSVDVLNVAADSAKVLALLSDSEPADTPPAPGNNSWLIRANAVGCPASSSVPVQSFYTFWNINDPRAQNLQLQTDLLAPGTHNIYINRIPDNSAESYPSLPFYAGLRLANGETLLPVALRHPEYFHLTSPFQIGGGNAWFNEFWGVKWFNQDNSGFKGLPLGTYIVKFFTPSSCNYSLSASQRKVLAVSSQYSVNGTRSTTGMTAAIRVYDQLGKPVVANGMTACNDKGGCVPLSGGVTAPSIVPLGSTYKSGDWATITLNLPANSGYSKIAKRFCASTSFCQFPDETKQIKVKLENNKQVVYGWVLNKGAVTPTPTLQTAKSWTFNAQVVCPTGKAVSTVPYSVYSAYGTTSPTNWVTWPRSGVADVTKSYVYTNVSIPSGQFGYINAGSGPDSLPPYGGSPNPYIQYSTTTPYTGNTRVRWNPLLPSGSYTMKFTLPAKTPVCAQQ